MQQLNQFTIKPISRHYPAGKAQAQVVTALGLPMPASAAQADEMFAYIGITVTSKRQGRTSVPVVTRKVVDGWNGNGDADEVVNGLDIDFTAISEWMI